MNDKVKEILDNIKNKYDGYLVCDIVSGDDLKLLLDYINQLQFNWNSLREFVYNLWLDDKGIVLKIRDKMNELESGEK